MAVGTLRESIQCAAEHGLIATNQVEPLFAEAAKAVPLFRSIDDGVPVRVAQHWSSIPRDECAVLLRRLCL